MKPVHSRIGSALALVLALAACVPQPRSTPSAEPPPPAPAPTPTLAPQPVIGDWMDAPATPGDWRYTGAYAGGVAEFGDGANEPRFTMRCDAASRAIVLSRPGQASAAPRMTIRTESQTRTLAVTATTAGLEARLAAGDRLLDALALSKGRFAVEVSGMPTLYLPSWAEVTRVIEDCR